ncbi:hypothetical protein YC2023_048638 [Brassica napus]
MEFVEAKLRNLQLGLDIHSSEHDQCVHESISVSTVQSVQVDRNLFALTYVTWKRKRVRGSGSIKKRRNEIFLNIRKRVRVGSLPQGSDSDSDSDSGSKAGSGRLIKLPCNVAREHHRRRLSSLYTSVFPLLLHLFVPLPSDMLQKLVLGFVPGEGLARERFDLVTSPLYMVSWRGCGVISGGLEPVFRV